MQQTNNYKLNLIETSDTFSPAPLNENAQKTEDALAALGGAVAGLDLRPCLIKLGEFAYGSAPFTFHLPEGVDLTQYRALVFTYYATGLSYVNLEYGGERLAHLLNLTNGNGVHGAGVGAIVPVGEYIYAMTIAGGATSSGSFACNGGGRVKADWAAMDGEFKVANCGGGTRLTLYGLRA